MRSMEENREQKRDERKMHWVWNALIIGFMLFSLTPALYELSRAGDLHPDRQFELVHNFPTDYNFYLSRIREGLEGRWTVVEKYTSEPHNGSLIHEMYLLMGRVGRMVSVPWGRSGDIYHVARIVLAVTLLALIAEFCKKSFKGLPALLSLIAFLLTVTASSWPKLVAVVNNTVVSATVDNVVHWRFGGYMSWWSVMDVLQRITFVPHLLFGQALIVFLVASLTSVTLFRKTGSMLFLGALAFVLGMVFPPGLIFLYGTIVVFGIIWAVWERKISRGAWVSWGGVVAISVPALLYLMLITSVYPWHRLTELDILHPLPFVYWEYFQAVGPMLPLGLVGMVIALWKKEKVMLPAVSWVIAWLLFLIGFHFVPQQSPLRFSEMIPHVPLGILTAYLFYSVGSRAEGGIFRRLWLLVPILVIVLGLGQMYSSYLWQKDFIDHKIRATLPLVPTGSYVMYPLKDVVLAMKFLEEPPKNNLIVLSETTAGNYIPVYSGNTVYVGHDNTINAEAKKAMVKEFFAGKMTKEEAKAWLATNRIRTVYFGPQEREDAGGKALDTYYSFLTGVYTNPSVTIYTIR